MKFQVYKRVSVKFKWEIPGKKRETIFAAFAGEWLGNVAEPKCIVNSNFNFN